MRVQLVFWKQLWPLFKFRNWKDSFHRHLGLKYSVLVGPIEFRVWGEPEDFPASFENGIADETALDQPKD